MDYWFFLDIVFNLVLAMNFILFIDYLFSPQHRVPTFSFQNAANPFQLRYLHHCRSTSLWCIILHLLSFWTFQCEVFFWNCLVLMFYNGPCMFIKKGELWENASHIMTSFSTADSRWCIFCMQTLPLIIRARKKPLFHVSPNESKF